MEEILPVQQNNQLVPEGVRIRVYRMTPVVIFPRGSFRAEQIGEGEMRRACLLAFPHDLWGLRVNRNRGGFFAAGEVEPDSPTGQELHRRGEVVVYVGDHGLRLSMQIRAPVGEQRRLL